MRIEFLSNATKTKCEKGTFFKNDPHLNRKLAQRIRELEVAEHLLDIKRMPQLRLHQLSWNLKFQVAVDVSWKKIPYRITFELLDGEDVFSDWYHEEKFRTVTHIRILEIGDYH